MMRFYSVIALTLTLSGCSWLFGEDGLLPDNSEDYKSAPEFSEIAIPSSIESANLEATYPIPGIEEVAYTEGTDVLRPAPLTSASEYETVRIQKLGEERWMLSSVAPGQLWPQVRAFLNASGIGVAASDARSGLIDTQYVTLTERELPTRFRFRVDSGVQRNTSELHILQQDSDGTDRDWPQQSDDSELESSMLTNIAQFVANSADAGSISMVADRAMGAAGRITLVDGDAGTRIQLALPFNRAWASVGKALPESGFAVDDKNRSEGVYYVSFIGTSEEREQGWFDWLWGSEKEHPLAGRQYLVKLAAVADDAVVITLSQQDGSSADRKEQQALLTLLKGNIS